MKLIIVIINTHIAEISQKNCNISEILHILKKDCRNITRLNITR